MSEETEEPDYGAEASAIEIDPYAAAMAIGGASRAKADAFLDKQSHLADRQIELLANREEFEVSHLRWRRFSDQMKGALQVLTVLVGLGVAIALGAMVWSAAHADGLVIEGFSVPPDLAGKGITGQVIASEVLDRLSALVSANRSSRAAKTYANNWTGDIKVEIPDTGISVGEAYNFLKDWLGHETRISGEVIRTKDGVSVTARVSGSGASTVSGSETDMDGLVQNLAEHIFAATQPYRYGIYLMGKSRIAEALAVYQTLALRGPPQERPFGYIGWANALAGKRSQLFRDSLEQKALDLQPDNLLALINLIGGEISLGQLEKTLQDLDRANAKLRSGDDGQIDPAQLPSLRGQVVATRENALGAYHDALSGFTRIAQTAPSNLSPSFGLAQTTIKSHDPGGAPPILANLMAAGSGVVLPANVSSDFITRVMLKSEMGNWQGVLAVAQEEKALEARYPGFQDGFVTGADPLIALAQAQLGNFAAAETIIAPTPGDCVPCLQSHARIARMQGQNARADYWLARIIAEAPSTPFGYYEKGAALLARGQSDAAIAQFKIANAKGPHFADPLEGWGEALMAQNHSDLALAKFKEANQYAPNWGRLHLKWGEALFYAGKTDDAKKQFAIASGLELSAADKAELMRHV
jgi:tetratricopeptide (TPR) repeat protein